MTAQTAIDLSANVPEFVRHVEARPLNGIIGENDEMNAQTLPKVKMPNQPNFIIVYPSRQK